MAFIRIISHGQVAQLEYGDIMSAKDDFRSITEFQADFDSAPPVLILTDDKQVSLSCAKNTQFFAVLVP